MIPATAARILTKYVFNLDDELFCFDCFSLTLGFGVEKVGVVLFFRILLTNFVGCAEVELVSRFVVVNWVVEIDLWHGLA